MSKIMRVFYDNAGLPYKDSALSIHYPILEGGEFIGANNTTDIYFYTTNLGDFYFVANCKLPNGALVDKLLTAGSDEFGTYYALSLDSELTEFKGHLKVALKGYGGDVNIETETTEDDTTIVVINGNPTIVATGIVDIAINYAPLVHHISTLTPDEYTALLAVIGQKLNIVNGIYVIANANEADLTKEGQLYYVKANKLLYRVVSGALVIEKQLCVLETSGQTTGSLTSDQLLIASEPNSYFVVDNDVYLKQSNTIYSNSYIYKETIDTDKTSLKRKRIVIVGSVWSLQEISILTLYGSAQADNKFVAKTNNANKVYATDNNGNQTTISVDSYDGNIVRRNTNNSITVPLEPTQNGDAASKGYADTFGKSLDISIDSNYVVSVSLKDKNGNTLSAGTIDLPLESVVVGGSYDSATQSLILTLDNGNTISIPVSGLINGLVKEIEVSSVLTTNELLTTVGTNTNFVLDNMGEPLLCYISEDGGSYTISFVGKDKSFKSTFSENTLVINLLNNTTLDIDYLPIVELTNPMQTLTSAQMEIVNQDNSVIKYNNRLYYKGNIGETTIDFVSVDYDIVDEGENQRLIKYEIFVNKTTGSTNMLTSYVNFYSSGEIDTKLEDYAKVNGYYPTMGVGQADSIASDRVIDDVADACPPITFGSAGGNAEIQNGFEKFTELHGNSVAFNQMADFTVDFSVKQVNGITIETDLINKTIRYYGTATADASCGFITGSNNKNNLIAGHKYLLKLNKKGDSSNSTLSVTGFGYNLNVQDNIYTANSSSQYGQMTIPNGASVDFTIQYQIIDLALLDKDYTSVVEFNRDYPLPYYEFNAGTLLSSKSTSLISVGMNQFDGELEPYGIVNNTGLNNTDSDNFRTKNYIRVISGAKYLFLSNRDNLGGYMYIHQYDKDKNFIKTISYIESGAYQLELENNTCYVRIHWFKSGSGWSTNPPSQDVAQIVVSIYYGVSNLPYQSYKKQIIELPNIELRSAGSIYDIAYYTGGGKRRIKELVFDSSTTYVEIQGAGGANERVLIRFDAETITKEIVNNVLYNILTNKYINATANQTYSHTYDKIISLARVQISAVRYCPAFYIYDSALIGKTVAQIKETLAGLVIYTGDLEETDITTEENPGWTELVEVDNYGTLEFTSEQAIQVPQAYYIEYTVNLVEFLDTAYLRTNGNGNDIALVSELNTIMSNFLKGISGYDDTKTQTLKNVSGIFQWVDD